jgi:hypothetical protein
MQVRALRMQGLFHMACFDGPSDERLTRGPENKRTELDEVRIAFLFLFQVGFVSFSVWLFDYAVVACLFNLPISSLFVFCHY